MISFFKFRFNRDIFKYYDKKINNRYILITHNSDRNVGEEEISYISKNVIHWFAQT